MPLQQHVLVVQDDRNPLVYRVLLRGQEVGTTWNHLYGDRWYHKWTWTSEGRIGFRRSKVAAVRAILEQVRLTSPSNTGGNP